MARSIVKTARAYPAADTEMVDLDDVRVLVRGQERFRGPVQPSLVTLLDSYLRRRDWGLLYPAKITITDDATWESRDQLKLTPR